MFDSLTTEIAKGVPGWAWIRTPAFSFWIGTFLATGILGAILFLNPASERFIHESGWFGLLVLWAVLGPGIGGIFLGLALLRSVLIRIFPSLEIVDAGREPKARRVGAITFSAISLVLAVTGEVLGVLAL